MDKERLKEIKERLEGTAIIGELYVKGDPWKGYEVIDDHNGMFVAKLSNGTEVEFLVNAPKDISELLAEVERVQTENERLRKALEFYADAQSYEYEILDVKEDGTELCHEPTVIFDDGKRAREALQNG